MNPEFLIVTPLVEEWEAVCGRITNPEINGNECRGYIGSYVVVCVLTGAGEERTSALIANSIIKWEPRWIILTGIAAGLGRVNLGDIILATHIYGYNFGKIEGGKYVRRPDLDFSVDQKLLQHAQIRANTFEYVKKIKIERPDNKPKSESKVYEGYAISGNFVIDDIQYQLIKDIQEKIDEIDCIEMEAVGAGIALRSLPTESRPGFMMVRGISDCPGTREGGKGIRAMWKIFAADVAAAFVEDFILTFQIDYPWEELVDRLLDSHFSETLKRSGVTTTRDAIEKAFGVSLKVVPLKKEFPAIVSLDRLDPDTLFDAKLDTNLSDINVAFERHTSVSSANLELLKLYEEPDNYEMILNKLMRGKILFLCGDAGVGKSLGCLRIVRDLFNLGIHPLIPPLVTEDTWHKLEDLKSSEVLFLDDPFGKSDYIVGSGSDKSIYSLLKFMNLTQKNDTGYLLISTRINIFQNFLNQINNIDDERRFTAKQEILTTSNYSDKVRQSLLLSYAKEYNCQWLSPEIKELSSHQQIIAQASKYIDLPLNIKHFCYETNQIKDVQAVLDKIKIYEGKPLDRYLRQLNKAEVTEILYIVFAYYLQNAFLEKIKLKNKFSRMKMLESYEGVINLWSNYESKYKAWLSWESSGRCRITHPSIEEAILQYFKVNESAKSILDSTFNEFINDIYDENARATAVAGIIQALKLLTKETKNLLNQCARDNSKLVRTALAYSLAANIPQSGDEDRELLILILKYLLEDNDSQVKSATMSAIMANVNKCGKELESKALSLRNDLDLSVRRQLAWAIASNFNEVNRGKDVLRNLVLNDPETWVRLCAGEAIVDFFEYMDDETRKLMETLAKDKMVEIRRAMVGAIESNFPELTRRYKDIYLILAEDPDMPVIEWVIWVVGKRYSELLEAFGEKELYKYLLMFAKNPDANVRKWVAEALGENRFQLSDKFRGLLKDLIEDRNPSVSIAASGFYG